MLGIYDSSSAHMVCQEGANCAIYALLSLHHGWRHASVMVFAGDCYLLASIACRFSKRERRLCSNERPLADLARRASHDQQGTVTYVPNGGHWINTKINSGHSGTEIETFRCRALAQRLLTVTKGSFPASHLCEFGFDCVATRYRPKWQHRVG